MYITLTLFTLSISLILLHLKWIYNYWSKQHIPSLHGVIPGIGNMWPVISLRRNFFEFIQEAYVSYAHRSSMIGFYNMTTPAIIVCDPKLVNTVLDEKFTSFYRNKLTVDPILDPIFHNSTIFTYGHAWSISRKRLLQAFSTSKLKMIFAISEQVGRKMEIFLDRQLKKEGRIEIELRDLFSRYTAEIVANAAFGMEAECFKSTEHLSTFQEVSKRIFEPSFVNSLLQILVFFIPWLNKICGVPFLPKEADHFLRTNLQRVIEERKKENINRSDFFQHIVNMERDGNTIFDENALIAHAFTFYTDAYGTTSVALSYVGYQLARYQKIQDNVREEINSVIAGNNGALTYESLKRMTYLSQIISESQRMKPTEGAISKICTRACELTGSDGLSCHMEPGTEIIIPMQGLHVDSRYWKDPHTFDPDRFNQDRVKKINKHTFIPFSFGPRMCPGNKMALVEMKACLSVLLRKYKLTISPRTRIPLKMSPGVFLPVAVDGIWAYVEYI